MIKTLKYKLYKNKRNKLLHRRINISGLIWNHCIALHKRYYRLYGKSLNANQLKTHIAKIKKQESHMFWSHVGSQAIQDIVERIDRSYKLFFRNIKKGLKAAPPKFKKVKKYKSFTLKQSGWKLLEGNKIRIQGHTYKYCQSRPVEGTVKTVTVKRDALNNLWLFFVVEDTTEAPQQSGNLAVGFDFGLKTFLTASDGSSFESPLFLEQSLDALRKASKAFSRKVKFSKGWYKAKLVLVKVYQGVANRRQDWFFKLAHELTNRYDILFFEDLSLKGMSKLWGRKVNDLAFSEFMQILEWVATKKGKLVGKINRWYPSSKTCSSCGAVKKDLTLSDREWVCTDCGVLHDRDLNASVNICSEGIRGRGLEDVRLAVPSQANLV